MSNGCVRLETAIREVGKLKIELIVGRLKIGRKNMEEKENVNQENSNASEEINKNEEKKTFTLEEVEKMKSDMKQQYESSFDEKFNKRWSHAMRTRNQEDAEKDELINLLKEQTGKDTLEDLLNLSYEQYGVERPKVSNSKDDEILGKYDAKEILELDEEAIVEEANRLAGIKKRTAREQTAFMEIGKYLTSKKNQEKRKNEIKEAGIDEEILNDKDFNEFAKRFKEDTSIKEIYDVYNQVKENNNSSKKPFNPGSLKDKKIREENEYFTEEEFNALTRKDLQDPAIYRKAMKTRSKLFNN